MDKYCYNHLNQTHIYLVNIHSSLLFLLTTYIKENYGTPNVMEIHALNPIGKLHPTLFRLITTLFLKHLNGLISVHYCAVSIVNQV